MRGRRPHPGGPFRCGQGSGQRAAPLPIEAGAEHRGGGGRDRVRVLGQPLQLLQRRRDRQLGPGLGPGLIAGPVVSPQAVDHRGGELGPPALLLQQLRQRCWCRAAQPFQQLLALRRGFELDQAVQDGAEAQLLAQPQPVLQQGDRGGLVPQQRFPQAAGGELQVFEPLQQHLGAVMGRFGGRHGLQDAGFFLGADRILATD